MNTKHLQGKSFFIFSLLFIFLSSSFGASKQHVLKSPDNLIQITINSGDILTWSVTMDGSELISPSPISILVEGHDEGAFSGKVKAAKKSEVRDSFQAINYRKAIVKDEYNLLILEFKNKMSLEFRAYNDAVAYRILLNDKKELIIKDERVNFNFPEDYEAMVPYLWDYRGGELYNASFESQYTEEKVSEFATDSLAILPLLVKAANNVKMVITEADLEDYPGMFLRLNASKKGYEGHFASYPLEVKRGGYSMMNLIPVKRAEYIARINGKRSLPWRVVAISREDKELLNNDIVQKLAAPSRIEDPSWITPGQVAWDWWDGYSISRVDFEAGMNTETFLYYIDFAANNKAKYIILDAGWSPQDDLMQVVPEVDLDKIMKYASSKNIGVILWASWQTLYRQMDEVFPKYAKLGVKGWKIDFIDRDDQLAVKSTYEIAEKAANYRFLVDYHGVFKPTGLQRTWPNVIGYEGVYGLENFKWADFDAPEYVVSIPFIRNLAGPVDYTPGAMINATEADFVARNHAPMSKGTRCHQVAQYVAFEVPIQMLSDAPTRYMAEQACTDFITSIPTVYDETVALAGEVGEFLAIGRRKGSTWYIGALTDWSARELELDLSFLGDSQMKAKIIKDGVNAHHEASDYMIQEVSIDPSEPVVIQMAPGGGWAAIIETER